MQDKYPKLQEIFKDTNTKLVNNKFKRIFKSYSLYYVSPKTKFDEKIIQNVKESKMIAIDNYQEKTQNIDELHFILAFKRSIVILDDKSFLPFFSWINSQCQEYKICFLSETKSIFDQKVNFEFKETKYEKYFENDYFCLKKELLLNIHSYRDILTKICSCASGYLIKQSYSKLNDNRCKNFNSNHNLSFDSKIMDKNDFVVLRQIGNGSMFSIKLIYHIEEEKLMVIKQPYIIDNEYPKLKKREFENYTKIVHPFLPKFYGKTKENDDLIIEYINGNTLTNINQFHFTEKEKITIIFQLLSVFHYLHKMHFIYRDLKPNNVMIDENKNLILIDFDRMIEDTIITNSEEERTKHFASLFNAPEINSNNITNKCDVYSIGQMIYYIITEKNPNTEISNNFDSCFKSIYEKCVSKDAEKRPSLLDIIDYFSAEVVNKDILLERIDPKDQYDIGLIYLEKKSIEKAIQYFTLAANQNDTLAQSRLGLIYNDEEYNFQDIKKSIHYSLLAAKKNDIDAQFNLGIIYKYFEKDIDKSIYYFELAAKQNDPESQNNLGTTFIDKELGKFDVNKAIHYFTLAADQNISQSQYSLGLIYESDEFNMKNINKAIHYFTLAADQNHLKAQLMLGMKYYLDSDFPKDINKSIYYFSLAAKQNSVEAHYYLGLIYLENISSKDDLNKAIYYFTFAADQNLDEAQYALGQIYSKKNYSIVDINKAIHFYLIAADQSHIKSQYKLGQIYSKGKYIKLDINKAIHYYTLAADQGHIKSQYKLGLIYSEGKYIKRDVNKAIYYISLAADQHYPDALITIARLYLNRDFIFDIDKVIYYLTEAAEKNISNAQFYLGNLYNFGKYIQPNLPKAIYFYSLAANNGDSEASFLLGNIFYMKEDMEKAIYYYAQAANKNSAYAQYRLGCIYEEKDINKSIYYFSL